MFKRQEETISTDLQMGETAEWRSLPMTLNGTTGGFKLLPQLNIDILQTSFSDNRINDNTGKFHPARKKKWLSSFYLQ